MDGGVRLSPSSMLALALKSEPARNDKAPQCINDRIFKQRVIANCLRFYRESAVVRGGFY